MGFIGVYKAVYSYTPTNDGELPLAESDLLYLLEKADDGWWTVKKRVPGAASNEPQGIVPHNYIEPAKPQSSAKALYSYDRQTDEELSFKEGQNFDVYATDGDWVLVGAGPEYGFVPSNYIQTGSSPSSTPAVHPGASGAGNAAPLSAASASTAISPAPATLSAAPSTFPASSAASAAARPIAATPAYSEDVPPPRPQRPQKTGEDPDAPQRPSRPTRDMLDRDLPDAPHRSSSHADGSKLDPNKQLTWPVTDISGRRRVPKTIVVAPTYVSLINDDGGGHTQKWDVHDIKHYSSEKKHVFLDLEHPHASLELKAASQAEADRIVAVLGQIVGAGRGGGLQEVLAAAKTSGHKQGQIVLDFRAANSRELSVAEDETVFVLNDKDPDWWLVRNISGREGLVPRRFVHIDKDSTGKSISGFFKGKKQREKERERDLERQHESARRTADSLNRRNSTLNRERSVSRRNSTMGRPSSGLSREKSKRSSGDRPLPDSRKVRLWVDRTGAFKVDAQLLGCSDGKVHLHKTNGVKIAVPVSKLSVADVDYVESVTGVSLNDDKPLIDRAGSLARRPTQTSSSRNSSPATPAQAQAQSAANERHDAWLTFFLECGIDPQNANRYSRNFTRDNLDVDTIGDVSSSVLRTLGLKEGDILRVTKKVNEKLGRVQKPEGGLYSTDGGALQNNSGKEEQVWAANQVQSQPTSASAVTPLTAAATGVAPIQPQLTQPVLQPQLTQAQLTQAQLTQAQPQQIQAVPTGQPPTGALAELLGISSPNAKSASPGAPIMANPTGITAIRTGVTGIPTSITGVPTGLPPTSLTAAVTGVQALQAQKTAEALVAQQQRQTQHQILKQQAELQKEQIRLLKEQQEQLRRQQNELVQIQKTGSQLQALGPFATGVAQLSSFVPSAATVLAAPPPPQPRGFQAVMQPIQPTPQPTFQPQATGPFQSQATGPFQSQITGPAQPQATGPFQSQITGPFQSQRTGPFQTQPSTSFLPQTTGPFQAQPTATSASAMPFQAQTTTGPFQTQQRTGPFQSQPTAATTSFQSAATTGPFQPQQQQRTGPFVLPTSTFGQPPGAFGQPTIQPSVQPSIQPMPTTSFGQPQPVQQQQATGPFAQLGQQRTGPFASQPFQSQATGPFQTASSTSFPTQVTGPFQAQPSQPFQSQITGPFQAQPGQPFQSQITGPFQPQPSQSFQSQPTGPFQQQVAPAPTTFGNQFMPSQRTGPFQTIQPSQTSFGQQTGPFQTGFAPQQTTFTQQPTAFAQQPNGFAQQPVFGQAPNAFGQQATTFGQSQPIQSQPMQAQVPLQNQATGFGFGNQAQPRANLSMASASNPFGL